MADVRVVSVPNHRNVVRRRVCRLRLASILCAASIVGVSGCAHGPTDNYGQGFGVVALMPAQTQKVWIGPAYQLLRVCIDLKTTGSAVITIDDRQPKTLRPGLCTEDNGNTIEMSNPGAGIATVIYRTIFEPPPD